jgi:hypothetical protein
MKSNSQSNLYSICSQRSPSRHKAVRTFKRQGYFPGDLTGSLKAFANAWSDLKGLVSEMENTIEKEGMYERSKKF